MKRFSIEKAIGVLETAAREGSLDDGMISRITSLTGLSESTRSHVGGTLNGTEKSGKIHRLTEVRKRMLFTALEQRFMEKPDHYERFGEFDFNFVKRLLESDNKLMLSLYFMEETGGEPDLIMMDRGDLIFADCSQESPEGRRNVTYDQAATTAKRFGVDMMSRKFYMDTLQKLGRFDLDTWSWLKTPPELKDTGYALSGSRDVGHVRVLRSIITEHNSVEGWRGILKAPRV